MRFLVTECNLEVEQRPEVCVCVMHWPHMRCFSRTPPLHPRSAQGPDVLWRKVSCSYAPDATTPHNACPRRIESTYNYPLVGDPRDVLWFLHVNEALLKTTLKFHFTCAQYAMTHILSYVAPVVCFDGFFFRAPRNAAGVVVLHKLPHQ